MQIKQIHTLTQDYTSTLPHHLRSDFKELLFLMNDISPDAVFSIQLGMPLFELDNQPLYGVTVRSGHLSLYVPEAVLLDRFAERLRPAHIGADSIFFDNLEEMNVNVIAELLSRIKGNFIYQRQKQQTSELH